MSTTEQSVAQAGPDIWNWELFEVHKRTYRIDYERSRPNNELALVKYKYLTGGILEPGERPRNLKALESKQRIDGLQDITMIVDMYILVSRRFRAFLADFEIGTTVMSPAPVTSYDGGTTLEGWSLLNIGAYGPLFVPEESTAVHDGGRYWQTTDYSTYEIAIHRPTDPIDLWMEPTLFDKVFVSDRLKTAIEAERFTGIPGFRRCRIVQ